MKRYILVSLVLIVFSVLFLANSVLAEQSAVCNPCVVDDTTQEIIDENISLWINHVIVVNKHVFIDIFC